MLKKHKQKQISLTEIIQYYHWKFYAWRSFPVYKPRKPAFVDFMALFRVDLKLVKKLSIIFLLVCLNWYGINAVSKTEAFFTDQEKSIDNLMSAGILDISLTGEEINFEDLTYKDTVSTVLAVADEGSIDSLHGFAIESEGDLCQYLDFSAYYMGEEDWQVENVSLEGFSTEIIFSPGVWNLALELPKAERDKQGYCFFDINFEAFEADDVLNSTYWDVAGNKNWIGTGKKADIVTRIDLTNEYNTIFWEADGNSVNGFKVIWSMNPGPTYPTREGDKYHYFSSSEENRDVLHAFDDWGMYYVRVCEYLGGECGVYSNEIEMYFADPDNIRVLGANLAPPVSSLKTSSTDTEETTDEEETATSTEEVASSTEEMATSTEETVASSSEEYVSTSTDDFVATSTDDYIPATTTEETVASATPEFVEDEEKEEATSTDEVIKDEEPQDKFEPEEEKKEAEPEPVEEEIQKEPAPEPEEEPQKEPEPEPEPEEEPEE